MPRRRRSDSAASSTPARSVAYRKLVNPFPAFTPYSDAFVAHIHGAAMDILAGQGLRLWLPEARDLLHAHGARIEGEMVFLSAKLVEQAIKTAPCAFTLRGASERYDVPIALGTLCFHPGSGTPNATDALRGRRPGSQADLEELLHLTEHFDVLHTLPPIVEAQDISPALRHLHMMEAMLRISGKIPSIYGRGTAQALDCFEMLRRFRGMTQESFAAQPSSYCVINTNSPRQIDQPMAQALIDFARAGQALIITPFTLIGAMAPITVPGALTLSHAEALAAITIAQLASPGAPLMYGTFTSNVHMKSGAPAFGTPEHVRATALAGQLARHIGLPWRSAAGSASTSNDAQGASETLMGTWGALMAGATTVLHAAGWLEGGLAISYEKLITDVEALNMIAELCQPLSEDESELGLEAILEVQPGGHFFETPHTMARYRDAFYPPIVHDYANFGTWQERGGKDAAARATKIWQDILANPTPPQGSKQSRKELTDFIQKRAEEGGALPLS